MRLNKGLLNEAKIQGKDESAFQNYSGHDLFSKYKEDFKKGLNRKTTSFYKNQGEVESIRPKIGKTRAGDGTELLLIADKDTHYHVTGSTRDPSKTRKVINIKLVEKSTEEKITLLKKVTIGEDNFQKQQKQIEKVKEFMEKNFGVEFL